ncbi:MAG: lytic transglycosylase [Deltaproteobacteria bacterium]|nr:MAG: lytic transglycosylase [Deltaproteobacteria bacterium]
MSIFSRNRHTPSQRSQQLSLPGLIILLIILLFAERSIADIYKYVDENGVLHFSTSQDTAKHQLYIREKPNVKKRNKATNKYDKVIWEASKKYGVSFPLIKAIIRTESNFNPWAISEKGAKGLMQIMPQNFDRLNISDPFNPRQNIMGGTKYFKQMLNRFHGRLPLALAAYNAGPSVVSRYQGIPPYPETRRYVKKVMAHYNRYKVRA